MPLNIFFLLYNHAFKSRPRSSCVHNKDLPCQMPQPLPQTVEADTPLRTLGYPIKYIRTCRVSCLLCLRLRYLKQGTLSAPGRCLRPPALRALELLLRSYAAQNAAPMLSKELRPPR